MILLERNSQESDIQWLWTTYKALLREPIEQQWGWDESFQVNQIFSKLELLKFKIVSKDGVDVAAYLVYEKEDHYYLKMLLVVKGYQGLGIGRRLLERLQLTAKENGMSIKLSVINTNPVIGFYDNLNFQVEGESDGSTSMAWNP